MLILPNGELHHQKPADGSWPLLRLAFRPFFLAGALVSIISLWCWFGILSGHITVQLYGGALWWHSHEMLFGFAAAIMVGFLLTAVQTWTKQPSLKGTPLLLLLLLWLLARLMMWFSASLPGPLIALCDLLFLPCAAWALLRLVVRVRQWRNLFFVPLLLAMTLLNALQHWLVAHPDSTLQTQLNHGMILLISLLMCIMAGRIFPMFTANGTRSQRVQPWPWLERLAVASLLAACLIALWPHLLPPALNSSIYALAGTSNLLRGLRWRIWITWNLPLLWSLHLSYLWLSLGLLALGCASLGIGFSSSQAIHILTVGAMAGMILAMIARVSLGHTGRLLVAGKRMAIAFAAINLAMLVRVFALFWWDDYLSILLLSVLLWSVAFGLFLIRYLPILTRPRADGQPG